VDVDSSDVDRIAEVEKPVAGGIELASCYVAVFRSVSTTMLS
jgi:hypothetical protein